MINKEYDEMWDVVSNGRIFNYPHNHCSQNPNNRASKSELHLLSVGHSTTQYLELEI